MLGSHATALEDASVEAWTVVVEAFANDLSPADDNATVAVMERGLVGLLEAERHVAILARGHF